MTYDFKHKLSEELKPLWRFALTLSNTHSDAEDLLQNTIVRAMEKSAQYRSGTKLRSWLFSIMHSIWLNEKRSLKVRATRLLGIFGDHENQEALIPGGWQSSLQVGSDVLEQHQLLDEVMNLVVSLPEAQRYVVILVCVEGFSYQETAEILGIKVGTVMSRLARARLLIGEHFLTPTRNFGEVCSLPEASNLNTPADVTEDPKTNRKLP